MDILTFTIGILTGFTIALIFNLFINPKKKKVDEKPIDEKPIKNSIKKIPIGLSRGIYMSDFETRDVSSNRVTIHCTFEVKELERTDTKSKVKVISAITDKSKYNKNPSENKAIMDMVDNSWIKTSEIEWIKDISDTRNDKIDQILGNNQN